MKSFSDAANSLQRAPQQRREIAQAANARRSRALKRRFMTARNYPGLVGHPRRIGAEDNIVSASFDDAKVLPFLLRQNIAEHAALFILVIVAPGAEFVEHSPRHKCGSRELRCRMAKFLSGAFAVILENADVFEPAIALQILNPKSGEPQKLFEFEVANVPDMTVMPRILQQYFMSADGTHAIIQAVPAASRFAFDMVKGIRMNHRARRPGAPIQPGEVSDDVGRLGRRAAKTTGLRKWFGFDDIVARDHPRTRDRILAKFHGVRRTKEFVICN